MNLLDDLEARGLVRDSTDKGALRRDFESGDVSVYYGCDPTADSLHVGNLIGVLMLRRFRQAGYLAIALAGGATGMIGDPGGKSVERNLLDHETLTRNVSLISEQLERISGVELVNNYDWLSRFNVLDYLREVGRHFPIGQMIAKDTVRNRLGTGISFTEFSYQSLQAHDYAHLYRSRGCNLQMGGSDQWGNIVAGVDLIRRTEGASVHAFTWPLLLRSDGKKFGKSEEGAVWIGAHRTPQEAFYRYWLDTTDEDVLRFLLQLTLLPVEECHEIVREHETRPQDGSAQQRLACEVTRLVHGDEAVAAAEAAVGIPRLE